MSKLIHAKVDNTNVTTHNEYVFPNFNCLIKEYMTEQDPTVTLLFLHIIDEFY